MATIIQAPDNEFARTLKDLIVDGDCEVAILLEWDSGTFIEVLPTTHFTAGSDGRVVIPLRSMLRNLLDHDYERFVECPWLTVYLDGKEHSYHITEGADQSTDDFDKYIRTVAPQLQTISAEQPLRLSVKAYGDETCYLNITGYYANGQTVECTMNAQYQAQISVITLDISYQTVNSALRAKIDTNYQSWAGSKDCVAFDVQYVIRGYEYDIKPRRYVLRKSKLEDKFFLFQNQRGGYDVICFTGEEVVATTTTPARYTEWGVEHELEGASVIEHTINTGYIKDEAHRVWVLDFLRSNRRWLFDDSGGMVPIVVDVDKAEHTIRALNSYSFKYRRADAQQDLIVPQREDLEQFIFIK